MNDDLTSALWTLPEHAMVIVRQDCGKTRLIQSLCSDPLCAECSAVRASRVRARWLPVLLKMHYPRLITLTMKSAPTAKQAVTDFRKSFRRLLDLRLGTRGLPKLLDAALDFVRNPSGELKEMLREDETERVERWEKSIEKFKKAVERKAHILGRTLRMRDVIGRGMASAEITFNPAEGWHFHRHCCVAGQFIPWPVLVAAWTIATKGDGCIVDIRRLDKTSKSMKEVCKYVTKPWEIPDDKRDEVRQALRGLKRVWPLGDAKPVESNPVCPFCEKETCKAHRETGVVSLMDEGTLKDGTRYRQVWDGREEKSYLFVLEDGVWAGFDAGESPLDLIHSGIACHSDAHPSTAPPVFGCPLPLPPY